MNVNQGQFGFVVSSFLLKEVLHGADVFMCVCAGACACVCGISMINTFLFINRIMDSFIYLLCP